MKTLIPLLLTSLLVTSCLQSERSLKWAHYKETALQHDLVPLHPKELYPEDPERGYVFDAPVLAGKRIPEEERAKIQQAMQQATQIQVRRVRAANDDHWCTETTTETDPAAPITAEMRQLFERWASAPEWLRLEFHNFDVIGTFCSQNHYIFLDDNSTELGELKLYAQGGVCMPEGQDHYDDMVSELTRVLKK